MSMSSVLAQADDHLIQKMTIHNNRVTIVAHEALHEAYLKENYFAQYTDDINLTRATRMVSYHELCYECSTFGVVFR